MLGKINLDEIYAERRASDWTEHSPKMEYTAFIGVEDEYINFRLGEYGWDGSGVAGQHTQHILFEMPEDMHYGFYNIIGSQRATLPGFYSEHEAKNGNGRKVYIHTGKLIDVHDFGGDYEAAFAAALGTGLYAEIPTADGSIRTHQLTVLKAGALMNRRTDSWRKGVITIKDMRTAVGMTQQQLADKAGVTLRQLQRIESGETSPHKAGAGVIVGIADALGIDVHEIII